jgi:alginate O-acetyltransferase complex protein AlgI
MPGTIADLWHHVTFVDRVFLCAFIPAVVLVFIVLSATAGRSVVLLLLIAASFVFYLSWGLYVFAIFTASMALNYSARQMMLRSAAAHEPRLKRAILAAIIIGDLCGLGYFKYRGFFSGAVASFVHITPHAADYVIPLGISFYTFQEITLAVDAYRGAYRSTFLEYVLFISFFPHLVAGPLVHHREMIQQFRRFRFRPREIAMGASLVAIGLFKKTCIADPLAPAVKSVFDHATLMPSPAAAWLAALAYGFELYFDFSGYSDMALGFARLFGIRLPINFNSPYKAISAVDFWRRWHLTLSRFLREYLYIPLGGNRRGEARRYANLLVVMLLGGLWHGANWTFMLWGGLHGVYLVVNHLWTDLRRKLSLPSVPGVGRVLTFICVTFAWVAFRAPSVDRAFAVWGAMLGLGGHSSAPIAPPSLLVTLGGQDAAPGLFAAWLAILYLGCLLLPNALQIMGITRPFPGPDIWAPMPAAWPRWRSTAAWGALMGALIGLSFWIGRELPQQFIYWSF